MSRKRFEEFLKAGIVKKQRPNKDRALSLIEESEKKKKFLESTLKYVPESELNANFVADSCYDIIIELVRAKMHLDGYNSGSSHEAEVSYMEHLGFSGNEVRVMDELRYYRNRTKYYGTILTQEYADKALRFMAKVYPKLRKAISA